MLNSSVLDFEGTNSFTLALSTTDNGAPALSGSGTVTVTVTNVKRGAGSR